ncbi:MAG: thioredoxin family protein [Hansschlegelia sp.]
MIDRRAALLMSAGACLAAAMAPAVAFAEVGPPEAFSQAAFDKALEEGRPILVHVETSWCPICRAQKPVLAKLRAEERFKNLLSFEIDFDADKAGARSVGARHQSTIIVYKDGKEVGREVGESQPEWIEDLLERTL